MTQWCALLRPPQCLLSPRGMTSTRRHSWHTVGAGRLDLPPRVLIDPPPFAPQTSATTSSLTASPLARRSRAPPPAAACILRSAWRARWALWASRRGREERTPLPPPIIEFAGPDHGSRGHALHGGAAARARPSVRLDRPQDLAAAAGGITAHGPGASLSPHSRQRRRLAAQPPLPPLPALREHELRSAWGRGRVAGAAGRHPRGRGRVHSLQAQVCAVLCRRL
jgi:hypothetical protein